MSFKIVPLLAMLCIAGCTDVATKPTDNYEDPGSLGRWCAKPSSVRATRQVIELIGGPKPVARIQFGDGSSRERALQQASKTNFSVIDDPHGARYELNASDDGLGLYDSDDLIFFASRMAPESEPKTCLE